MLANWVLKILFLVVILVVIDRVVPFNIRLYSGKFFQNTSNEFWSKYGVISFPRTIFAVLIVTISLVDSTLRFKENIHIYLMVLMIALSAVYGLVIVLDTWRSRK